MAIQKEIKDDVCSLQISGEMTIYEISELKNQLVAALEGGRMIHLNLSQVNEFDVSALQLLAMLRKEHQQGTIEFHLDEASESVKELLDLFSLSNWIEKEENTLS